MTITMPNSGVSEKMQHAVRKLQRKISYPNLGYHSLSHNDGTPKMGGSLKNGNSLGGSIRNGTSFRKSMSHPGCLASNCLESDDRGDDSAPNDVSEGFLAVYVGQERRRFVIDAKNLNNSVFRDLLNKSAEEYGYEHKGGLAVACEVVFFERLLWLIETNDPSLSSIEIDEFVGSSAYPL